MVNRREFLGLIGVSTSAKLDPHQLAGALGAAESTSTSSPQSRESKAFGCGYFGEWITDQFGLAAYRYTCNQMADPKARTPVNKQWRSPTDQTHQVGNDSLVAAVSNYGYVQVRQDVGAP